MNNQNTAFATLGMSCALAAPVLCALATSDGTAQEPPVADPAALEAEALADSLAPPVSEPSPLGALLRSLAIPGWGHAYSGATTRAGIYLAFEVASAYAILRTQRRVSEVEARIAVLERAIRADLGAYGITHSEYVNAAFDSDDTIAELDELRAEREQQVEDWIAFGVFMLLLGAVDAYVSTHLREVPPPLELDVNATTQGRVEVGVRVAVGR